MKPVTRTAPAKRPVNLLLNESMVQQVRVFTRNLSSTVDGLLAKFVACEQQLRQDQQQRYAEVSGAWNRFEEAPGSFAVHRNIGRQAQQVPSVLVVQSAVFDARRRRVLAPLDEVFSRAWD